MIVIEIPSQGIVNIIADSKKYNDKYENLLDNESNTVTTFMLPYNNITNFNDICNNNFSNITGLNLMFNKIIELSPNIEILKNLRSLNLQNNDISSLPLGISQLLNLEELNLSNNKLEGIPDSLYDLVNLKQLYLNNNAIKYLSDRIGDLINLERFDIYNNSIVEIPESILNLLNLKYLSLGGVKDIPDKMKNLSSLPKLTHLSYSNYIISLTIYPGSEIKYLNIYDNKLCRFVCSQSLNYNLSEFKDH